MFLPVKMGELWPSCGRVVPSIGRVVPSIGRVVAELSEFLGELLGEIVKFRQLAQKRLGGHLCLGGSVRPFLLSKTAFFEENPRKNTQNHPKPPRNHPKTTQNYEKCTSEHQFLFFSDFLGFRVRKCQKGGYTGSLSVADNPQKYTQGPQKAAKTTHFHLGTPAEVG